MKVIFQNECFKKLRTYVTNCEYEISGLGKVVRDEKGNLVITDLRIFKQTVSPVETKLSAEALGRFYTDLINEGEDPGDWKLWWHSHASMGTFWSVVDVNTIDDFDNEQDYNNWMLSVENNHEGDLLARVDVYAPFRCTIPDLPVEIDYVDLETKKELLIEINEKVTVVEVPRPLPTYKYPGSLPTSKKKDEKTNIDDDDWDNIKENIGTRFPQQNNFNPLDELDRID